MAISKKRVKEEIEAAQKLLAELEPAIEVNKIVLKAFEEVQKKQNA